MKCIIIENILWFLLGFVLAFALDRWLWVKQWGKSLK